VVLLFLRVAGELPLRYWISCVYINTSTFQLFILSTQRAHTRHLLWQGEVVLLFLRVAGKLPLRYWISCVYIINTPSLHPVNTASSAAPLDIMRLYQYLYFSSCQLKRKLTNEYVDLCQTPSPTASRHLETNKSNNGIKGNNKEHHQQDRRASLPKTSTVSKENGRSAQNKPNDKPQKSTSAANSAVQWQSSQGQLCRRHQTIQKRRVCGQ
jgi:hypothetical protein